MKKLMVTAAALTLGTSALAWAPAEKAHVAAMSDGVVTAAAWSDWSKDNWSAEKSPLAFSSFDSKGAMNKTDQVVPEMFAKWQDPTVETAVAASADVAKVETGMGGPIEEPQGYLACRPGRGDDNCIQLYERGVHADLAAWKATEPNQAMGGPFEPAAAASTDSKDKSSSHADHSSMDHGASAGQSGSAMTDKPAAPATDVPTTKPPTTGSTTGTAPGAIGGPVESQSGYPPCRRGRGDDRCIQLYERGVAGRDN